MAEKIARFKQALRAKASTKQPKSEGALAKEIQKYKLSEKKERVAKKGEHHETDQISNKQVPDKPSKTGASRYAIVFAQSKYLTRYSNTSNTEKQEPHKKRDSSEGRYLTLVLN